MNLNEIKQMGFSYKVLKDGLLKSTGELLNKKIYLKLLSN
jgi:hypothetical protein